MEKHKKAHTIIKNLKISTPTWNDKFELPDGSYLISDIQDYFECILEKHGENIDNPSIIIYINKIENKITFKIKTLSWAFYTWNNEITWKCWK